MPELNNLTRPRVAILGVTGMIGSAIYGALKDRCRLVITYRSEDRLQLLYHRYGQGSDVEAVKTDFGGWYADYRAGFAGQALSPAVRDFADRLAGCDWVINAMGITKAIADRDPLMTLFINGAVPHILAALFGERLIHITTDCVFDGTSGAPYSEDSPKRPVDLYGLSKSIGEPDSALVLRTSTVGPELGTTYGLLDWLRSQSGPVPGFTNHLWNGLTARELGNTCWKIVSGQVPHPGPGVYHIFSDDVAKNDLLAKLRDSYGLTTKIEPQPAAVGIDRRLASRYSFCRQLNLPSLDAMLAKLPELSPDLLKAQ